MPSKTPAEKLAELLEYCREMKMSYSYKPVLILALLHGGKNGKIFIEKAADHVKRQAQIHLQQSNHALQLAASTLSRHVIQIKTDAERSLNHQIQQIEKAVTQIRTDSVQDLNRFQADLRHHTQNRIQIEQSILRQQSMALVHHVESTKARAGTELEQQIMAIRNAVRFNLMTEKQNLELSGQRIYDYAQKQKQNAKDTLNRYSETLKLLDPTDLY